jgi:hypothetical protein
MPNWTYTQLTITGKRRDLEAFKEKAKGTDEDGHGQTCLTFENFLPCPKELDEWNGGAKVYGKDDEDHKKREAELIEKYGYASAYDFHCEVWGTKWDACDADCGDITKEGKTFSLFYAFNTAWSPAEPALLAMSEQHPGLTFTASFEEEGGLFETYEAEWKAGEKVREEVLESEDEEDEEDEGDDLPASETDPKNN